MGHAYQNNVPATNIPCEFWDYRSAYQWLICPCRYFSGYTQGEIVPPLCPHGTFCPDEGSGCKALMAIGQSCQLGRNEQCAPPPNWSYLASGLNFNGSLCLNGKCRFVALWHLLSLSSHHSVGHSRYANITLGQACQIENTTYLGLDLTGEPIKTTVIRDDCHTPELFCDTTTMLCEHTKVTGSTCQTDGECKTVIRVSLSSEVLL
jgi:hypothetical protein